MHVASAMKNRRSPALGLNKLETGMKVSIAAVAGSILAIPVQAQTASPTQPTESAAQTPANAHRFLRLLSDQGAISFRPPNHVAELYTPASERSSRRAEPEQSEQESPTTYCLLDSRKFSLQHKAHCHTYGCRISNSGVVNVQPADRYQPTLCSLPRRA